MIGNFFSELNLLAFGAWNAFFRALFFDMLSKTGLREFGFLAALVRTCEKSGLALLV